MRPSMTSKQSRLRPTPPRSPFQRFLFPSIVSFAAVLQLAGCLDGDRPELATSVEQELATVDRTCSKDEQVLLGLRDPEGGMSCTFDEMCPCGSSCDLATNTCVFECLATTHPT